MLLKNIIIENLSTITSILASLVTIIAFFNDIFNFKVRRNKLDRLLVLLKIAEERDKTLLKVIDLQIPDELFRESTGLVRSEKSMKMVEFYNKYNQQFKLQELRLIYSRFYVSNGILKIRRKVAVILKDILFYLYYIILGFLFPIYSFYIIVTKGKTAFLIIPLEFLIVLSLFMITKRINKYIIYKRSFEIIEGQDNKSKKEKSNKKK